MVTILFSPSFLVNFYVFFLFRSYLPLSPQHMLLCLTRGLYTLTFASCGCSCVCCWLPRALTCFSVAFVTLFSAFFEKFLLLVLSTPRYLTVLICSMLFSSSICLFFLLITYIYILYIPDIKRNIVVFIREKITLFSSEHIILSSLGPIMYFFYVC